MIDRTALSRVAWLLLLGTLVVVVDFRVEGFDLVHDIAGAVLVIAGVIGLRQAVPQLARFHLSLLVLAGIALLAAIAQQIDPDNPAALALGWPNVIGAWLTARLLAEAFDGEHDDIMAAQWSASERLLLWLGIVPIVGLAIVGWLIESAEDTLALVTLVLALLPLLHLLVSLYRTTMLSPSSDDQAGPLAGA